MIAIGLLLFIPTGIIISTQALSPSCSGWKIAENRRRRLVIRAMPEEDKAAAMSPTAWVDARLQILMLRVADRPRSLNSKCGNTGRTFYLR
ncbi:MAG: hypothetical protein KKF28_00495, partial [Proteobacteria bacterium]|nr:hypothetical protein [Pseudomonadota bacterium]